MKFCQSSSEVNCGAIFFDKINHLLSVRARFQINQSHLQSHQNLSSVSRQDLAFHWPRAGIARFARRILFFPSSRGACSQAWAGLGFIFFTEIYSLMYFRISQGIDEELSLAAEAFLEGEDGCVLNMPKREVNLSVVVQILQNKLSLVCCLSCQRARLRLKRSGFEPCPGVIGLCSWTRYLSLNTLTVPLSTRCIDGYRRIKCWG